MRPFLLRTAAIFACLCVAGSATPSPQAALCPQIVTIPETNIPLAGGAQVLTPTSPGTVCYSDNGATIDVSNAADGYITVKYSGDQKAKALVTANGKTYRYTLRADGGYDVLPLTCGDGTYQIAVYSNVYDAKYAMALSQYIAVKLNDFRLPFLYPNQYVNFNASSTAILKASELAQSAADDLSIVSSIYNYVISNVTYDTAKAQLGIEGKLSGYLPDVDTTLATKQGICFDYAALMTAMLRSQQIPTRLEIGYVSGGVYHAWIDTYITGIGWINGVIQFDGKNWTLMDPTFASSSANPQYVGSGMNYQAMYRY